MHVWNCQGKLHISFVCGNNKENLMKYIFKAPAPVVYVSLTVYVLFDLLSIQNLLLSHRLAPSGKT